MKNFRFIYLVTNSKIKKKNQTQNGKKNDSKIQRLKN